MKYLGRFTLEFRLALVQTLWWIRAMDTHRTKQCRRTVTKAHFASASCQKMALKMGHAPWEDEMTVKRAMTFPSGDGTVLNIRETQVGIKLQKSKSCLHQLPSANNSSLKIGFLKSLRFPFSSSYLNDAMTGDTLGCYHTSRGDFKASNTPCMQHYLAILFSYHCSLLLKYLERCVMLCYCPSAFWRAQKTDLLWNSSALDSDFKILHPRFVQTKAFSRTYQIPFTLLVIC